MDFDCRLAVGSVTWTGDVEESRPLATDQKMKMMMMTIIATAEASWPAQSPAIVMGYLSLRLPFFFHFPFSKRSVVWLGHFLWVFIRDSVAGEKIGGKEGGGTAD